MSMKQPGSFKSIIVVAFLAFLMSGVQTTLAQMPGLSGGGGGMNSAMIALFGSNTAFSARAEIRVLDRTGRQSEDLPFSYAFSNGKMRMDIDLAQFKSSDVPAQFLSTLKQFGMDQTTVITRPDRKLTWSIYPHAKSYVEIPMAKEEVTAQAAHYKFDRTPQGRETVDGRDCEKVKVTLTDPKGDRTEAIVWTAPDLRSFPIQMQLTIDADKMMVISFRDVKLSAPDDGLFEAPGSLTKYDSGEALLSARAKQPTAAAQ
jgi:Domain of unknown function (DUF4412)